MTSYLVTIQYDPGKPATYLVENVADARAARDHVRENVIGYDPGVPVEVLEIPITSGKVTKFPNLGRCMD